MDETKRKMLDEQKMLMALISGTDAEKAKVVEALKLTHCIRNSGRILIKEEYRTDINLLGRFLSEWFKLASGYNQIADNTRWKKSSIYQSLPENFSALKVSLDIEDMAKVLNSVRTNTEAFLHTSFSVVAILLIEDEDILFELASSILSPIAAIAGMKLSPQKLEKAIEKNHYYLMEWNSIGKIFKKLI